MKSLILSSKFSVVSLKLYRKPATELSYNNLSNLLGRVNRASFLFQETELVSGNRFRELKWPAAGSKPGEAPVYARLKDGDVTTEKDDHLEKRLDFLHQNVVPHLFH